MKKLLVISFFLCSICSYAQDVIKSINGHEYVEIGGLKWATMNVGAMTVAGDYATCCGDYFAWSEAKPRYATMKRLREGKPTFTWRDDYSDGYAYENFPRYNGKKLDAAHDAATVAWGKGWRTPTNAEFKALAKACSGSDSKEQDPVVLDNTIKEGGIYWLNDTQTFEPSYTGVAGLLFVSASDISKRVFFPACGYVNEKETIADIDNWRHGYYWSSSPDQETNAYCLLFDCSCVYPSFDLILRCFGCTIRPVSN